jgi:hypothetical protein
MPSVFSLNVYTDAYDNHMFLLTDIKAKNENAYSCLLHQLYLSALYVWLCMLTDSFVSGNVSALQVGSTYLDTYNMETDD